MINAQAATATATTPDQIPAIGLPVTSDPLRPHHPSATTDTSVQPPLLERRNSPGDRSRGAFSTSAERRSGLDADSLNSAGVEGGGLANYASTRDKSDSLLGTNDLQSSLVEEDKLSQAPAREDTGERQDFSAPSVNSSSIPPRKPVIITSPSTPPNTFGPPTTFVTPPTPIINQRPLSPENLTKVNATGSRSAPTSTNSSPTSLSSAVQRRKRTGTFTSSKLATTPLTPHLEEAKTPGGTLTASSGTNVGGAGSFFSSVFSAAQNAATQLTNSINTSLPNQKSKPAQPEPTKSLGGEQAFTGPEDQSQSEVDFGAKRQLAVETLGQGDLSLSHLGISEDIGVSPMNSQVDLSGNGQPPPQLDNIATAEENAAARAVSVAYEKPVKDTIAQANGARPMSVASADGSDTGMQTPPRSVANNDGIKRSGSVRSKISDRRRRTRGSSAATGVSTLGAAISATGTALANPTANGPVHRLTGFAVASSKRNKDFHQLFRSVPEDDYLIEDYSAALQRDILLHGRLYVSEGHICFSSNILGWVTNLVISFDEVVSVEKKSTAMIFPNAIVIQTLHARNVFASLVARDSTYDLLIGIWKISHPNLKSSLNGVAIDDTGTGDKTEKAGSIASEDASEDGSEDEVYDEDEDDGDTASFYDPTTAGSVAGSDVGDGPLSRKTSAAPLPAIPGQPITASLDHAQPAVSPGQSPSGSADFPGPASHAATECTDEASHYTSKLTDTTIPAPLGKVYSLMWGPQSSTFMRTFLLDNQKSRELEFAPTPGGLDNAHKEFVYSYIKPLSAPVGPRQTKCIVTAKLEDFDLEKAVSVGCSTATPDVPSGGVFETKTRYCLMWGPGNSTRFVASCTVEWTGKSWLKGPIEKGANDGQIQYVKDLVASLRAAVAAKAPAASRGPGGKKGRSRRREKEVESMPIKSADASKAETQSDWGPFELLRGPLEPITSILGPMISAQVVIGFLIFLLAYSWFWPSSRSGNSLGFPITTPDRLAAYEEIWRREESELWDWLEDRVGLMDGVPVARYGSDNKQERQKVLARKAMGKRMGALAKEGKMAQGQVDDAIRVTEERLAALKDAVKRRKGE